MRDVRIRLRLWVMLALFFSLMARGPWVFAEGPREQRPGNDDIFIFFDSSLTMLNEALHHQSYLETMRTVLLQLVDLYVKQGDFILIGSCDSDARIEVATHIRDQRDLALLREQIQGLDVSRVKYYEKLPDGKRGRELKAGDRRPRMTGGGQWTDLGGLLELVAKVLRAYSSPEKRQLVLIFTDGEHDPPEYSKYRGNSGQTLLDKFLPIQTIQGKKIGVVAIPKEDGAIQRSLIDFVKKIDPDGNLKNSGMLESFTPETIVAEINDYLKKRVDLEGPGEIILDPAYNPVIKETYRIVNNTKLDRLIKIRKLVFISEGTGTEIPLRLSIDPSIKVGAENSQSFEISGKLSQLPPGDFAGKIKFDMDDVARFHPTEIAVSGRKLTWMQKYAWILASTVTGLLVLSIAGVRYWRRAVWVGVLWRNDGNSSRSNIRKIKINQTLKFGGTGSGSHLQLDGPGAVIWLGEITRRSVRDFSCHFTPPLDSPSSSSPAEIAEHDVTEGAFQPVHHPTYPSAQICFLVESSQNGLHARLNEMLKIIRGGKGLATALENSTHSSQVPGSKPGADLFD